jgi:hypothetical protein
MKLNGYVAPNERVVAPDVEVKRRSNVLPRCTGVWAAAGTGAQRLAASPTAAARAMIESRFIDVMPP